MVEIMDKSANFLFLTKTLGHSPDNQPFAFKWNYKCALSNVYVGQDVSQTFNTHSL